MTCSPLTPPDKPTGFVLMSLPPCTQHQFCVFAWRSECRARLTTPDCHLPQSKLSKLDRTGVQGHAMLCRKAAPASGRPARSWRHRRRPAAVLSQSQWRPLQRRSPCQRGPWPAADDMRAVIAKINEENQVPSRWDSCGITSAHPPWVGVGSKHSTLSAAPLRSGRPPTLTCRPSARPLKLTGFVLMSLPPCKVAQHASHKIKCDRTAFGIPTALPTSGQAARSNETAMCSV